MATTAIPTTLSDGDGARVTQWRMPPGTSTGQHVHEFDYVVLPTIGGTVTVTAPGAKPVHATMVEGEPYFRNAGVEHEVENLTDSEIVFVELELK
jgi:quercetin dioxygenase-like cupin family protein